MLLSKNAQRVVNDLPPRGVAGSMNRSLPTHLTLHLVMADNQTICNVLRKEVGCARWYDEWLDSRSPTNSEDDDSQTMGSFTITSFTDLALLLRILPLNELHWAYVWIEGGDRKTGFSVSLTDRSEPDMKIVGEWRGDEQALVGASADILKDIRRLCATFLDGEELPHD